VFKLLVFVGIEKQPAVDKGGLYTCVGLATMVPIPIHPTNNTVVRNPE